MHKPKNRTRRFWSIVVAFVLALTLGASLVSSAAAAESLDGLSWDEIADRYPDLPVLRYLLPNALQGRLEWNDFLEAANRSGFELLVFNEAGQPIPVEQLEGAAVSAGERCAIVSRTTHTCVALGTIVLPDPAGIEAPETWGEVCEKFDSRTPETYVLSGTEAGTPWVTLVVQAMREGVFLQPYAQNGSPIYGDGLADPTQAGQHFAAIRLRDGECVALGTILFSSVQLPGDLPIPRSPLRIEEGEGALYLAGLSLEDGVSATVGELQASFEIPAGASVRVLTAAGETASAEMNAATGMQVELTGSEGSRTSLEVVVTGDACGTGVMGIQQLVRVARALTGMAPLEGPYFAAVNFSANGRVDLTDLIFVARMIART